MEEKKTKGILGSTLKQTFKQIKDSRIDAMLEDSELKYRRQIEDVSAKLPITDNLLLTEKLQDIIKQKSVEIGVDTEDIPKERYHDRTFPKNYYKKKKAKRRIQKQSRRKKYL